MGCNGSRHAISPQDEEKDEINSSPVVIKNIETDQNVATNKEGVGSKEITDLNNKKQPQSKVIKRFIH